MKERGARIVDIVPAAVAIDEPRPDADDADDEEEGVGDVAGVPLPERVPEEVPVDETRRRAVQIEMARRSSSAGGADEK